MKYLMTTAAVLAASAAWAETPVLTVYAGDYFTSEWGPGPKIEAGFEEICECDLEFSTGDLMPRLLLEGARTKADVVIGLTTDVTAKARATVTTDRIDLVNEDNARRMLLGLFEHVAHA